VGGAAGALVRGNLAIVPSRPAYLFVPQAWSLAYELLFYAAFAAFFVLPRRAFRPALAAWLGASSRAHWPECRRPATRDVLGEGFARLLGPLVAEFLLGCFAAEALRTGFAAGWGRACLAAGVAWFAAGAVAECLGCCTRVWTRPSGSWRSARRRRSWLSGRRRWSGRTAGHCRAGCKPSATRRTRSTWCTSPCWRWSITSSAAGRTTSGRTSST